MLNKKTVLITGGAGFLGRGLAELVLERHPSARVVIFSRDELKQHEMRSILPEGQADRVSFVIGDVRDRNRIGQALRGVDYVVHAAAQKQLDSCESNPIEAVKTNIFGAAHLIDGAIENGVQRVLAVSTDKAVSPVSLYGATKLCAEKLFIAAHARTGGKTRFSSVRCGNIAGSPGSVLTVFLRQRERGEITITDSRMTRFFCTREQAARWVLRCLSEMRGGEIFVPRMPSVRIADLARAAAPGCPIRVTGIRSGEKLHESLISSDESRNAVELPEMFVILSSAGPEEGLEAGSERSNSEEFTYRSDRNAEFLSLEQIREMTGLTASGCEVSESEFAAAKSFGAGGE